MDAIALILIIIGGVIALVGNVWFLVEAFREHILWGLGTLLLGIVGLIFLVLHLDRAGKPFLVGLGGTGIMLLGSFLGGA